MDLPDQATRARPRSESALFVLCGTVAAVGAYLPWATVSASFIDPVHKAGIDGDGRWTLALGAVVGLLGLVALVRPPGPYRAGAAVGVVGLVLASMITGIALVNMADVRSVTGPLSAEARILVDTSVGVGLWFTLAAGMAGVAGGVLALLPPPRGTAGPAGTVGAAPQR